MSTVLGDTVRDFRCNWKQLFLGDLIYKAIAFILLTPLVATLFRMLIATSGGAVLADQDILLFFLAPVGWFCLITVGSLWIGIVAIELATLMAVLVTSSEQPIHLSEAFRYASANAWRVSQVTARMVAFTLLTAAPFLVIAGVVYFALLSEFDINYYLKEKPPAFLVAVGIGAVLVVILFAVLLRLFTGWLFALPIVLFEDVSPSKVLRVSRERASGHRGRLAVWILGWFLATLALSALATAAVIQVGCFFVPQVTGSLGVLAIVVGLSLLLWAVVGLVVNLLSMTSFAALHINLYRHLGCGGPIDLSPLAIVERAARQSRFRVTQTRLVIAVMVGILAASAIGGAALRSVRLDDDVVIMAHRGSSKAAPENTIAAVNKAIEDQADWVEIDVQETADGEVVVFHDSDFMKLAGVDLKIWDATVADLKDIDIGSRFAAEFKDERVPTLGQVLDRCKGKIGVNIELKYYGHDQQLEQRVVEIVEAHGMADSIITMSLKIDAVRKMKSIRPDWKAGLLMSVAAGDLAKIDADFLAVNADFVGRSLVRSVHASGKELYVWTVNDATAMSAMIGRGVDGLITDRPAVARNVLQQRSQLSVPERLLLELAENFGVVSETTEQ